MKPMLVVNTPDVSGSKVVRVLGLVRGNTIRARHIGRDILAGFRHLVGGGFDCMSCGEQTVRYSAWKRVSWLNARHPSFAWTSLVWVAFTDIYVRLVSMGLITDLNTWTN